ncbi:MAG: alanine racemase [Chitinispirillales bacterium]|nr:alanine racemase [Chitinispirillales bacterium]
MIRFDGINESDKFNDRSGFAGSVVSRPLYSPYVEISLDNILHNIAQIRSALPRRVGIIAVVKDCSYGCASVEIAKTLERDGGIDFFAVARPREAFVLRQAGIVKPILVLGMAEESELRSGVDKDVIFTLNDLSDVERWKLYDIDIRFHLNIDTGMSRMGILPSETDSIIEAVKSTPSLWMDGVFTHMACADEPDTSSVSQQLEKFTKCVDKIRKAGLSPTHIHYENSATFLRFPSTNCTLVRPGISLYGCKPDPAQNFDINLKPVASLISRVAKMKKVPAGTPVSYGWNYVAPSDTWIATIPLGYAHGLPRFLSNRGMVLINGSRYRIAGNVTMDYIMADVGANPSVSTGDEVVAIGSQGDETITPDDIAIIGGTIGYEIICNLGTSIPRFYTRNGETVHRDFGVIL